MKKDKRFLLKEKQNFQGGKIYIIMDTHTGVHYLSLGGWGPQGISPLLDSNGKIIIEKD